MSHRATRPIAIGVAFTMLSGCAAPGRPGTGAGADYTPVIDTAGLDMSRYEQDLSACRALAGARDVTAEMLGGVFIGALLGGALAAAAGGGAQTQRSTANYGGVVGGSQAIGDATSAQKTMMINCMVGRGYRALEVTPPLGAMQMQQAYQVGAPAQPIQGRPTPVPIAPAVAIGQESHQVERMPEIKACAAQPIAQLIGKGPGIETYSVTCASGDILSIRCESGACRVLR